MNMQQALHRHDSEYNQYLKTFTLPNDSLFVTDVDLWSIYLDSFEDGEERQYHNCHACKAFIQKYGCLITIDPDTGKTASPVWNPENAPAVYTKAITAMRDAVERATVTGIFFSSDAVLGTPVTGEWTHYAVRNPNVYSGAVLTAGQKAAERKEDYRNVSRAIGEFKITVLEQVAELLRGDALYRSEKVLGQAEWLYKLKGAVSGTKHQMRRKNIVWKAVADAPSGFCHPRSGMIGTLLEDIESGMPFEKAAERFKDKMHPLQYRRPSAAPTAGAILAAEKRVKEMGVEPSLSRRFATMDDMETIWTPVEEAEKGGGVFDHLKGDAANPVVAVGGKITWEKFRKTILPAAKKIEVTVPSGKSDYIAFVTAADSAAPLIFQWNNPVSWYHWHGGAPASQYGLTPGWVAARAVCLAPYMWGGENLDNFGDKVAFILDGAKETKNEGSAIFPETLRSDFHAISGVIEAHSRKTKIIDAGGEHVIGKGVGSTVRVHTSVVTQYEIDRWD